MRSIFWASCVITLNLSGCSPIVNTVNGLTTTQSSVSGSNYPFYVKPGDGDLLTKTQEIDPKDIVGKKESFKVSLDAMFLRYLQASDPYVMIYSEAWMGSEVMPLDKKKLQRQIVLIKDGLSFNARTPQSSIPILGPVTMGDDSLDVHVSVYVVVLSKDDNQKTVDFLNGVAAVASTAAPQYSVIAGAAADVGKAIVAQNRDKVEFEHSFDLTPIHTVNGVLGKNEFGPYLAEGKLAVIKGENKDRLVPYQNWFYYLSPFNWIGHTPDANSVKYEYPSGWKGVITPDESANLTIPNLPFAIAQSILIPDSYLTTTFSNDFILGKSADNPLELKVEGSYLIHKKENDVTFSQKLYHDKTYAIFSITRTDGSYGTFDQMHASYDKAGYGDKIDSLITTRDDSLAKSKAAAEQAITSLQTAISFERAKKQLSKLAENGLANGKTADKVITDNGIKADDKEDIARLENIYWDELTLQSAKRLKSKIITYLPAKPNVQQFCDYFASQIAYEENYWRYKEIATAKADKPAPAPKAGKDTANNDTASEYNDDTKTNRDTAWTTILSGLSGYLQSDETTKEYAMAITNNMDKLKIDDNASPNTSPAPKGCINSIMQ